MAYIKAFSLIELLIVLAIIAVMAAIAYPVYNTYLVKARVAELFTFADMYRLRVVESGASEAMHDGVDERVESAYIDRVFMQSVNDDPVRYTVQIIAKMRSGAEHGIGVPAIDATPLTITFTGLEQDTHISWSCHVPAAYAKYVPQTCAPVA